MKKLLVSVLLGAAVACASTSNDECQQYVSTGADLATIIADLAARDEDRAAKVAEYAELAKAARGLGCGMADLEG